MSGELLDRVSTWAGDGAIAIFDDHVEVRSNTRRSWRYEEIRSVRLNPTSMVRRLCIKNDAGETISVLMRADDGLRVRRLIEANRRKLKKLREIGFESLEDFEAEAEELGKRFRTK